MVIQYSLDVSHGGPSDPVATNLSISATTEQLKTLQKSIITDPVVPGLSIDAKHDRRVNDDPTKDQFRTALLSKLRQTWTNPSTESHFLTLVAALQNTGCTILAGLIEPPSF